MSTSGVLSWLTKLGLAILAATAAWGDTPSRDTAGATGLAAASPAAVPASHPDGPLGSHRLATLDGGDLRLADLAGEIVVVNFWASWCKPCRKEVPELNDVHRWLSGREGRVVAVSIDHDRARAARFASRQGMAMTVCHDGPDGLARALDISSVPFTLVLDRDGRIAHTVSGQVDEGVLVDVLAGLDPAPRMAEVGAEEDAR